MGKPYIPIFLDWLEVTGELNAQEKGRLIDAIVTYARGEDWQEQIKGNERYLFPAFRGQIDRAAEISGIRSKATESRRNQKASNDIKSNQNESNDIKNANKEEYKEEEKNKNKKESISAKTRRDHSEEAGLFARFWEAYPRKTAKSNAIKAFHKLKPDEALVNTMLAAIEKQKESAQWSDPQFIPHPATWLNGKRWEDEVVQATGNSRTAQTQYGQREYEERKEGEIPAWLKEEIEMMGGVAG